jgi:hypothetical protein
VFNAKKGATAMKTAEEVLADFVREDELAEELKYKSPRTVSYLGLPSVKIGGKRFYHRPTVQRFLLQKIKKSEQRGQFAASAQHAEAL